MQIIIGRLSIPVLLAFFHSLHQRSPFILLKFFISCDSLFFLLLLFKSFLTANWNHVLQLNRLLCCFFEWGRGSLFILWRWHIWYTSILLLTLVVQITLPLILYFLLANDWIRRLIWTTQSQSNLTAIFSRHKIYSYYNLT